MIEPPIAILCTISQGCIKDQPDGYRGLIKSFEKCDGEKSIFWWRMTAKPKHDVLYFYFVIGGKIRWKAKLLQYVDGGEIKFDDGRTLYARCWALLIDFERLPNPQVRRSGFQGFRYFTDITQLEGV